MAEVAQNNFVKHYLLGEGVILSAAIKLKIGQIADRYFKATGEDIVITSGRRTFLQQAEEMYDNRLRRGRFGNFKAKRMIAILEDIFKQGTNDQKTKTEITQEMSQIISIFAKRGIFISKHIIDGAVDVRSRDMKTSKQREAFRMAASGIATSVILESNPPHWHLQF